MILDAKTHSCQHESFNGKSFNDFPESDFSLGSEKIFYRTLRCKKETNNG